MRVLVAGGTGVLGSAVVQRLRTADIPVTVLSRAVHHDDAEQLRGDVRVPDLGLSAATLQNLRREVTHVVSSFGSVELAIGPQQAMDVHGRGSHALAEFFRGCRDPQCYLHVSSILVFGRSDRVVGNHDLDVGQRFRNWYEYGKFVAETVVRRASADLPVRILRLGPVLGADGPVLPSWQHGFVSALPYLLKGWPVPLAERGAFPCYAADSTAAAAMVHAGLLHEADGGVWTYYDPGLPSLNQAFTALCNAWGVVPLIVDAPGLDLMARLTARRLGLPPALTGYLRRWVRLEPDILAALPVPLPSSPPDYLKRTGEALRSRARELMEA